MVVVVIWYTQEPIGRLRCIRHRHLIVIHNLHFYRQVYRWVNCIKESNLQYGHGNAFLKVCINTYEVPLSSSCTQISILLLTMRIQEWCPDESHPILKDAGIIMDRIFSNPLSLSVIYVSLICHSDVIRYKHSRGNQVESNRSASAVKDSKKQSSFFTEKAYNYYSFTIKLI